MIASECYWEGVYATVPHSNKYPFEREYLECARGCRVPSVPFPLFLCGSTHFPEEELGAFSPGFEEG